MNFKTTGLLLTLLIIAIGVGWLFFSTTPPEEPAEPAGPGGTFDREEFVLRPQPKSDTIVRVTVEHAGRRRLVFERSPRLDQPEQMDKWVALEPLEAPVQDYMVSNLVRTFADLKSRARFEVGAEQSPSEAEAGISPPLATVTLAGRDGQEYRFEVGQKAAMSNDTYVRVAGTNRIHVATRDLLAETRRDFNQYRDRRLMALTAADAVRVEIRTEQQTCVLVRGEDQAWMIEEPVKAHAAGDEVLALLRKIAGLRAQEFAEDAPASLTRYGLDRPHMTVMVTTETPREVPPEVGESAPPPEPKTEQFALAVGGFVDREQEQRFAKPAAQPWVVRVSQTDVVGLMPDLAKLRDPKITRVAANDATRLELTADGVTVTLEKVDGRWQGTGDLAALEIEAVMDLLEAFEDLSAIDYAGQPSDLAACGLDQPRAVVTVTAGDSAPVTVHIGDLTRSARNAYVLREGQPTVFVVAAAQAARLAVPPLSLRSRSILTADERAVVRLEVVRGATHYVLERQEERWRMSEPAGAPLSSAGVRVLVGNLSRLRARRVVGKDDDARFGIDRPVVTVRFAVQQPGPMPSTAPGKPQAPPIIEHTLRVGWKDTVAYCRIDDDPYVFELDQTVYRVLIGELIDRQLFSFAAEEVVGLTVVGPGGTLELAKEEDEWKFTPDPFVELAQKKVSDFVGELASLRVESYIEYRDADLEAAGLSAAPVTVTIRLSEQRSVTLKLEQERAGGLPLLAGWLEQRRTFRLRQADCEKLLRGVDYYLTPEAREPQTPPGPGLRPPPPRP